MDGESFEDSFFGRSIDLLTDVSQAGTLTVPTSLRCVDIDECVAGKQSVTEHSSLEL